jgi:hypothetical protein
LVIWKVSGQRFVLRQLYIGEPTKFGQTELAVGRYAAVWNVQFNQLKQAFANDTQALYLLTRESSVAFAAPDTMVDQDILQRPLVQEFIKSPLSRAVTGIRNSKEGPEYYFYMVVPETNLVLFVESDATRLFLPLFRPAAIILSLLVVLLGFILMIWKNITGSLTDQTLALSEALEDFSRGLLIPTQLEEQEFSKELHPLVLSINQTTRGIRERIDLIEKKKS